MERLDPRTAIAQATLCVLFACTNLACQKPTAKSAAEDSTPAKVEKLPHETELATVTLTEEAEQRLGITTEEAVERQVPRHRTLSGQVVVPSGKTIVVTSPLAGTILGLRNAALPLPGEMVVADQALLLVKPLLSAERDVPTPAEQVQIVNARATLLAARTVASGDAQRSQAEVDAARISLARAQQLFADRAGPRRAIDDAEAQLNIATSNLDAARLREQQLSDLLEMLEDPQAAGEVSILPMTTPVSGVLNRIEVREGQTIATGAMLFEVVNLDTVWLRVPVYVDQLDQIDSQQPVHLSRLSGERLDTKFSASPIAAPPTANAQAATADLYYAFDNKELGLRPGQRVGVDLPLLTQSVSLVVPSASVLYDIQGNSWVYAHTGQRQFTRKRVEISFVDEGMAVLATGPQAGTQVVVEGAAELFGTEFGAGK